MTSEAPLSGTSPAAGREGISLRFILALSLFCVVLLVFLSALRNEFVNFDDGVYVTGSPIIDPGNEGVLTKILTEPYYYAYIPTTLLSHALDWKVWGTYAPGHHLTSIVLGALNASLFFFLALSFGDRRPRQGLPPDEAKRIRTAILVGACSATLLFALHPLRAETMNWVSDRKDLLAGFFLLLGCLLHVRYLRDHAGRAGVRHLVLLTVIGVLAGTSKSFAVMYPVLLLLCDVVVLGFPGWREAWVLIGQKIPMFIVSGVLGVIAMHAAPAQEVPIWYTELSSVSRWMLPPYTLAFYVGKTIVPFRLLAIYLPPSTFQMVMGTALTVLLLITCIVAAVKGWHGWWVAWLAYGVLLAPSIAGIATGGQAWSDRYSYLAMPPLFLLLSAGISRLWLATGENAAARRSLVGALAVLGVLLAVRAVGQGATWRTSETLWSHQLKEGEVHPSALNNLALVRVAQGRKPEARQLLLAAIAINPHAVEAFSNLAEACPAHDDTVQTIQAFLRARETMPIHQKIETALAGLYAGAGREDSALAIYQRVLALDSACVPAINGLAMLRFAQGEKKEARMLLEHGLKQSPGCARLYFNLGVYYGDAGDNDRARQLIQTAARLGDAQAQGELMRRGFTW